MANERDRVLKRLDKDQAALMRQEDALVRDIARAYEGARKELTASLVDRFSSLGPNPDPATIRQLASDSTLIQAIRERLAQLEGELGSALRDGMTGISQNAFDAAYEEILLLAQGLGVDFFTFALDPLLELTVQPAIEQIPDMVATVRGNLIAELRQSLAAGDRLADIVARLYGLDGSIFRNGMTSAELMARRAVIQANNNARHIFYEQAAGQIPGLQKQVVAAIQAETTETCLRVHGQIRNLDEPFDIAGTPSFGAKQMIPPFHWNCRSSVVAYHPRFEERSSLTTASMVAAASQELANR